MQMQFLRDLWGGLTDRMSQEPVLVLTVVQAALAMGVGFGLGLTGDQVALIVTFSAAVLGLIARQQVKPV